MLPEESEFLANLYRQHFSALFGHAIKLLKLNNFEPAQLQDLAEELVQVTFHTASKKVDLLRSHPNPGGWLMLALKCNFKAFKRQVYSDNQRLIVLSALPSEMADPCSGIGAVQSGLEYHDAIARIRDFLSPEDFQLFDMVAINHVSHRAAAEKLGITIWASQKRLERIRRALQNLLSQ